MLQTSPNAITIAEEQHERDQSTVQTKSRESKYEQAAEFDLGEYSYPVPGFIRELLAELDKDVRVPDARLVDEIEPTDDIDDGMLVVYPDESFMFIGKDPTAKDTIGWYAFTIEPMEPIPEPTTAREALDLLKPPRVQDIVEQEGWTPDRHGEWWLLPSTKVPLGETFSPGVKSKPYGPSPLGNHVPREYAFTEPADRFMDRFTNNVESAPRSIATPPEVIKWSWRQQNKEPSVRPDDAPSWAEIREWAGDVLVRGTIRHRDDDHFVENVGGQWHEAVTHRMEVYTSDEIGEGVHLDYYGT